MSRIYRTELRLGVHDTRLRSRSAIAKATRASGRAWSAIQRGGPLTRVQRARLAIAEASAVINTRTESTR